MNENQLAAEWQSLGEEIQRLANQYRSEAGPATPEYLEAASKIDGYLTAFKGFAGGWSALAELLPQIEEKPEEARETTAQRAYYRPLGEALFALGGSAATRDAIAKVGEAVQEILMPADFEPVRTGQIRWIVNVRFARQALCQHGLLKSSPVGIWALSDAGKRWIDSGKVDLPTPVPPEHPDQAILPF